MANEENLIPFDERSESEARENGKKGGIASGKARRKKANLKKALETILSLEVPDEKLAARLSTFGIDPTMEQGLAYSLVVRAIAKGDPKAFETIRSTLGQTTTLQDRQEQKARTEKLKAEKEKALVELERVRQSPEESARESVQAFVSATKPDTIDIAELFAEEESDGERDEEESARV